MQAFLAAVEEPGNSINIIQPTNVPQWKQGLLEMCINPSDGSFNAGLYKLACSDMPFGEFLDIVEVMVSHADFRIKYQEFGRNWEHKGEKSWRKGFKGTRDPDELLGMIRSMGVTEQSVGASMYDTLKGGFQAGDGESS